MDTRTRFAAGFICLSAVFFVAAWFLLGTASPPPVEQPRRGVGPVAKRVQLPPPSPVPYQSARAEAAELPEEDATGVKVTKSCKLIVDWQKRNVPDFVILDNLQARGQRFEESDLACLTASGVSPGVLRFAEHRPQTPKLEGAKVKAVDF